MTFNSQKNTETLSPTLNGQANFMANPFGDLAMLSAEEKQDWLRAYSPTNLRYIGALRGYVPEDQTEGYTYALLNCGDGASLIALAACNPEGVFFGFDADAGKLAEASDTAVASGVENVKFVQADEAALKDALQSGALKPAFNYVVSNLIGMENEIGSTVTLASMLLAPGGMCYMAYPLTPGRIESQSAYVASYKPGETNTDVAHAAALAAQMDYVGSAKARNNYIEFSVHPDHQPKLIEVRDQPVFESLKDFAIGGRLRHDVWVKPGMAKSDNQTNLLQSFSFAVARPSAYIDPKFTYFGKKLDLTTPLFTRLLNTLAETSYSIGDLIAHPDFANAAPDEIVGGVQMLIAIGVVEPTRGSYRLIGGNFDQPHFAGSYNQHLRDSAITEEGALLAAPMIGRPVLGTAPMIMTLQAIDQGGLKGAEELLDKMLVGASDDVQKIINTDMSNVDARRNTAYRLLEQVAKDWLLFCYVNGIMQPA